MKVESHHLVVSSSEATGDTNIEARNSIKNRSSGLKSIELMTAIAENKL
jgi:uracil phosphoribosyltransferase